jgi:hypothetical protein
MTMAAPLDRGPGKLDEAFRPHHAWVGLRVALHFARHPQNESTTHAVLARIPDCLNFQ